MSPPLLRRFAEASANWSSSPAASAICTDEAAFLPLLELPPQVVLPALEKEIRELRGDQAWLSEGLHRVLTMALEHPGPYWPALAMQWLAQASVPLDGALAQLCRQRLADHSAANGPQKKQLLRLLDQWDEQSSVR